MNLDWDRNSQLCLGLKQQDCWAPGQKLGDPTKTSNHLVWSSMNFSHWT